MFTRAENEEIFVRRDWTYAGIAYHVCCWSAIGRPSLRVANPRQLRRAVRRLLIIQETRRFRQTAPHRGELAGNIGGHLKAGKQTGHGHLPFLQGTHGRTEWKGRG
jgi:hypothetical protein